MSFAEIAGKLRWECDRVGCWKSVAVPAKYEFSVCWRVLRGLGWSAHRDEGEWYHFCPKCTRGSRREADELMQRKVK
jgi:hypothetical protein